VIRQPINDGAEIVALNELLLLGLELYLKQLSQKELKCVNHHTRKTLATSSTGF
jgi:hypothetical protein